IRNKQYPKHRRQGTVQSARWLIQSQLDIAAAKNHALVRGDASLSSKLVGDGDVIDHAWRQHPLHFGVDLEWCPSSRASHYRECIYSRVVKILAQAKAGMTVDAIQEACPSPADKNRQASTSAIGAALKQLLL